MSLDIHVPAMRLDAIHPANNDNQKAVSHG
jgi:hypothetical protein